VSNCATRFAYANEEECFAVLETTCGALKKPTAADRMYSVGPVIGTYKQSFDPDEQIRPGASHLAPFKGLKNVGDWNMDSYVKPSGVRGTPPEHAALYQCLFGAETIDLAPPVPSTVTYSLANQLDSFSLWSKKGHTVFARRGCTVEEGKFNISGGERATVNWSGQFMEEGYAGEIYCNDTCNIAKATIQLPTGGAQLYTEGMYVNVGTDTNSGNGYLLTDVNYTLDTITISPTLVTNQGVNPEITPWWRTASAEVGEPVHGKQGIVTIDVNPSVILSAEVTIKNNIEYYGDEKNDLWTAERFGRPGKRDVTGVIEHYFLERGASYFYKAEYEVSQALVIPVGNVAGYTLWLNIPYARWETPEISGDSVFKQVMGFRAIASASLNDEITAVFR